VVKKLMANELIRTMTPPLKTPDWLGRMVASVISIPITTYQNHDYGQRLKISSLIPMTPRLRLAPVRPRRLS
jgi:hypothetical protein